jgi:hypothetical protein
MTPTDNRYNTAFRVAQWREFLGFETLADYQRAAGLKADGVFGPKTFEAMRLAVLQKCAAAVNSPVNRKVVCRAHKYDTDKGYDFFRFRVDAAYWYNQLLAEVEAAGGILTSAGSDRSLTAPKTSGRVGRSFHHAAIAFDLAVYSGMVNPSTDPYVIERDGDGWRVWVSCDPQRAQADKLPPIRTIENPITYKQRFGTKRAVMGHFLDLTELAARFHFRTIKPHKRFFSNGSEMLAEWWHIQLEGALVPNYSRFSQELEVLFSREEINKANLGDAVFGVSWF